MASTFPQALVEAALREAPHHPASAPNTFTGLCATGCKPSKVTGNPNAVPWPLAGTRAQPDDQGDSARSGYALTCADVIPLDTAASGWNDRHAWGWVLSRLVEFPLQDGGGILVQVNEAAGGPVTRGLGDRRLAAEQAQQTFEQAIARVQPAAQALISRLRALADSPDEVGVEFGLELSAEAGAFIAAASSTANFKVTLSWRRSSPPTTAASTDLPDRG